MPSPSRVNDNAVATANGRARKRKPLTERERAAKAERVAAYEARNAAIAARRETLAALTGVRSSEAAALAALDKIERAKETENARAAVVAAMSHPVYGHRLSKFIGNRPGVDPCRLLVVIGNWMATQGIVDHVAPTT